MTKSLKKIWLLVPLIALTLVLANCGGGGGSLKGKEVANANVTSTGDKITSLGVTINDDGELVLTSGAILKDGEPAEEGDVDVTAEGGDGSAAAKISGKVMFAVDKDEAAECNISVKSGEGEESAIDLVYVFDTTGSMGTAVETVAGVMTEFAETLSEAGVNARHCIAAMGDAFDTLKETGSSYEAKLLMSKAAGDNEPPAFDGVERPKFACQADPTDDLEEIVEVVGSGDGGGDGAENYYAASVAAVGNNDDFDMFSFRAGANVAGILIGDNCAHTKESPGDVGLDNDWTPASKDDVEDELDGKQLHAIWIGNGSEEQTCGEDQLTFKQLADATGGAHIVADSAEDVDFGALNLDEFLTAFFLFTLSGDCIEGLEEFIIFLTLVVDGRTQNFVITGDLEDAE